MPKTVIPNLEQFKKMVGQELGVSSWRSVTQQDINAFADATKDYQWIHVDVERCKKESPFKTPIAHGYYTLSLAPGLLDEIVAVEGVKMGVNYGLNKVRFTAPVKVDSKVRMKAEIQDARDIPGGGVQGTLKLTFEIEGERKAACVAEAIYLYYA